MKVQSYLALMVKRKDSDMAAIGRQDSGETTAGVKVTDTALTTRRQYKNYERLSRGAIEYMEPDEEVSSLSLPGDLVDAEALYRLVVVAAGFSMGLTRLFSVGQADASYSASRAEGNLAERAFEAEQKWVERYLLDWEVGQAIPWAISAGALPPNTEWPTAHSWHGWPTLAALDPAKEAEALRTLLAIGATDYAEILGPDWPEKLAALGAQIKHSRDNGVFAEPFQPPAAKAAPAKETAP
jgi:hypothetical protein